jgi:hypothetical protein
MAITVDVGKIKLQWRGTYNNSTAYEYDDVVSYDDGVTNSAYICVSNATGQVPSTSNVVNSTYWNLFAKGASASSAGSINGEIQYKFSSGFGADSVFVWDETNNRLGVNTASPTTTLDVNGTIKAPTLNANTLSFDNLSVSGISTFQRVDINDTLYTDEIIEQINVVANTANSTSNIDVKTAGVWIFTSNSIATWTHNIRGDASTSLNTLMSTGQAITVTIISKQNNTSYYTSSLNIDGSNRSINWLVGSAPSAGASTAGYDVYTWNIIKTGNNSFIVFGSIVQYG